MKSPIQLIYMLSLIFVAATTATRARAQEWDSIIDQLTDQTLLVASLNNDEALSRWLNLMDLPFNMDAQDLGDGQITIVSSATEFRLILDDPSGDRQKTFLARSVPSTTWKISRDGSLTFLSRSLMGGSASGNPLTANDKKRWQDALALRGTDPLFVAVAPATETRRVITELVLGIPMPESGPDLANICRELEWIATGFNHAGPSHMKMTLQASSNLGVNRLAAELKKLSAMMQASPADHDLVLELMKTLLKSKYTSTRDRIVYDASGDGDNGMQQFMEKLLGQQESWSTIYSVKSIILAMHNFESAYKHFPGHAFGKGDSRGLSWRVAILPWLEQQALYDQFHLDEPWDSEHNKTLIPKMPRVFMHFGSKKKASDGLSNFVVPTGPGLAFESGMESKFSDFKDGTSNTVLVMAVDDEHAEIWTKPVEQNFDSQSPRAGLLLSPMNEFLFGRADGSIALQKNTLSDDTLRALMTRAGGETIQFDK